MSLEVELKKTRLILLEDYLALLLCLGCPGKRWMFSDPDLLQKVWLSHLRLGIWNFHVSWASTLPTHRAFLPWSADASISSNSSMHATKMSPFQILSAYNAYPRNIPGKTSGPNWCSLDRSSAERGWYSTIAPIGITGPLNGIPNRLS